MGKGDGVEFSEELGAAPARKARKRWIAAIFSLAAPGMGHVYCGELSRGAVFIAANFVFMVLLNVGSNFSHDPVVMLAVPSGSFLLLLATLVDFLSIVGPSGTQNPILILATSFGSFLLLVAAIVDSWRIAGSTRNYSVRAFNRWYLYLGAFALIWTFNAIVSSDRQYSSYHIASMSMEPTLQLNDRLFAATGSQDLAKIGRASVVVFRHPGDPDVEYIKRLVGLPGDTVQLRNGILHINGSAAIRKHQEDVEIADRSGRLRKAVRYRETLPSGESYWILEQIDRSIADNTPEYAVPAGHVFVLGDNRDASQDSRFSTIGFVPLENIVAVPTFVYWSEDLGRIGQRVQ